MSPLHPEKEFCYVVVGSTEYEGWDIVGVFQSQGDADAYREKCQDNLKTYPDCPDIPDNEEIDDAFWKEYDLALAQWNAGNPAGPEIGQVDHFIVQKIPYFSKPK